MSTFILALLLATGTMTASGQPSSADANAAMTARATVIVKASVKGVLPLDQFSPPARPKLQPQVIRDGVRQLAAMGPLKSVTFESKTASGSDMKYYYRVAFTTGTLELELSVNRKTNLIDDISYE